MRSSILILFISLSMLLAMPRDSHATDTILKVGRVSFNPRKHYPRVKAFADYLVDHLGHLGYEKSQVVFTKDLDQLAALMKAGKVDVISETVYAAAHLVDKAGAQILLREWRGGQSSYKSVFLKRKGTSISNIRELEGKMVAFEDPGSTSSFYLPALEIAKAGLTLVEKKYPAQRLELQPGEVGFVFAYQEVNIALWIQEGLVDAGAMSDLDMANPRHMPDTVLPHLDVIHSSPTYPRSLFLVRGSLDPKTQNSIRDILLRAHEDPDGLLIMDNYWNVSKYDVLPEPERRIVDSIRLE